MATPLGKKIAVKVGAWFLVLAIVPLSIAAFLGYLNTRQSIIDHLILHLNDINHEKVARLESFVRESKLQLQALAATPALVPAMRQASTTFRVPGQQQAPQQHALVATHDFFGKICQDLGYGDIILINPAGDIVHTLAGRQDLGTNLRRGPYRDSGLARVFDQASTLLDTAISSFRNYAPAGRSVAFLATPVFDDKRLVGVLAAELDGSNLFRIFTDYLGLGESGELVAGRLDNDGHIIAAAPLRHHPEAMEQNLELRSAGILPIQRALQGEKGAGFAVDYRGREVLAAWQYVPSLAWGLVVKIDSDEALAPVRRQELIAATILILSLFLVVTGIIFATANITKPITRLGTAMHSFASGNFSTRAKVGEENEVGSLAKNFNEMADSLERYTFAMEQEVAKRTEELSKAYESLDRAQAIAHVGSWFWEINSGHLSWSDEIYRIFGRKPQEYAATYQAFIAAIHPDDRELVEKTVQEALEQKTPYACDHRVMRPDGSIRFVHERGQVTWDAAGKPLTMQGTVQDITSLHRVQQQLSQYITVVDDYVLTTSTDKTGIVTYVSDAFCRTCGYSRTELLGKSLRILRHPDTPASLYKNMWETIATGTNWRGVLKNKAKDGSDYWVDIAISPNFDDRGAITGYTAILQDITDKKKIERLSITDELTGLNNRRRFNELFPREFNRSRREGRIFTFLMCDVDFFKKYNDTYGHQAGDMVLSQVGMVLRQGLKRSADFSFRLGGEEFGALFLVRQQKEALELCQGVRQAIEELAIPHEKNSASPYVTVSCGFTTVDKDSDEIVDPQTLYQQADLALYQAKAQGRNRVVHYRDIPD